MDNPVPKPWWLSKTVLSCVGILVVTLLSLFGVQASDADGAAIGDAVGQIAIGVLALVGIYGRITAKQKIG
jgi:hypothetical protein